MCTCVLSRFSCVQLFVTPWTVAPQAPLSMGFSRQDYCSGLPFPSLEDLPNPGIKPRSPVLQAYSFLSKPPRKPTRLEGDQENLVHCTKVHHGMFDIPCCASKKQLEPSISKIELPLPQTYLPQAFPEPAHCTSICQFINLRT